MNHNPPDRGILTERVVGVRVVSRERLHARTRELALLAGREIPHVTHADYAQAKRELTGETDPDRQDAMIEEFPEPTRWDQRPGSKGREATDMPSADRAVERRGETEPLLNAVLGEAGRDQKRPAAEAASHDNRRSA